MYAVFESKPTTRIAHKITKADVVTMIGNSYPCSHSITIGDEPVKFTASEPVNVGDYVIKLNDDDIYHCNAKVFAERNVTQSINLFGFGKAIDLLKQGKRLERKGWNGKGMFAYYVEANAYPVSGNPNSVVKGFFDDDLVPYRAYLALKTAQNDVATWTPSVSDLLADDWAIAS